MYCVPAAIQLAKLSGFNPIITTASKANEQYCLSAGATHVVDYKSVPYTSLRTHITSNITSKPIKVIYDAISNEESEAACWSILPDTTEGLGTKAGEGGKLIITLPAAKSIVGELDENQFAKSSGEGGKKKSVSWTMGNGNFEWTSGDANRLARTLEGWLVEGKIKVRIRVFSSSLSKIVGDLLVCGRWSAPILWRHTCGVSCSISKQPSSLPIRFLFFTSLLCKLRN